MENIQRQKEKYQREISQSLAQGKMGQALDVIVRHGDIKWTQTKEQALEALVQTWAINKIAHPQESTLLIAYTNKENRVLNELVHQFRREAGELEEEEFACDTTSGKIHVSCGDRIEFKKNDKTLDAKRGVDGILVKATEKGFTVQVKEDEKTRHVTDDIPHLSALKAQAFRKGFKPSTLEYLTPTDLENQRNQNKKEEALQQLKSSDSIVSKLKGHTLSAFDTLRFKSLRVVEKYKDQRPDQRFFNPKLDSDEKETGKVEEVKSIEPEGIKVSREKIHEDFQHVLSRPDQAKTPRKESKESNHSEHWKKLSAENRSLLRAYYKSVDKSSSLHTIVKTESEFMDAKSTHFNDWQKACGERNAIAHQVIHSFKPKELQNLFGPKRLEILQDRAEKHEAFLNRNDHGPQDLDAKLKENLDSFLYRLFPEGPTGKDRKGLRFGAKGSLAVTCQGPKAGCFFDFEEQKGGGPLQLIQKSLLCSSSEAIQWAKSFVGEAPDLPVPTHFSFKSKASKEQEWVSLQPNEKDQVPSLKEISKGLNFHYDETARYTYRDLDGNVLFHTLRLESKTEEEKKIVLPLSFGHCKGAEEEAQWSLKSFQAEKKPLYGLNLLKEYPQSKVLIVEGEKAADAASKMFPKEEIVCLTSSGGAGSASKSDWLPLFGREVVIWPDNDRAGYEAAEDICSELRKVGIRSLHAVDKELLAIELPPKWDLADLLPEGLNDGFVKDMLLRAGEKAVGLEKLVARMSEDGITGVSHHLANEVLCRAEERLRPQLEEKHGSKQWEISAEILSEAVSKKKISDQ